MQIKHILFLVIVVILWYIYLNKCMCIETFNIGIPSKVIDEPYERLLECGNPFNTTVPLTGAGLPFTDLKTNQLSNPLLLTDNTYLFDGEDIIDIISGNIT